MVINSRRLMDDLGWNASSGQSTTFLKDGVHYTPYGAQVLAAAEAAAMMGQVLVAGCSTDQNSVVLQSTETLTVDLGGTTPCAGYGRFNVAQSLTLNGPNLNVVLTNGFTPTLGQSFQILTWSGTLNGTFGAITLPTLPAGLTWNTSSTQLARSSSRVHPVEVSSDGPLPFWAFGALGAGIFGIASRRLRKAV